MKIVHDYNPWVPEEGTLDKELWNRAQRNIEKTYEEGYPCQILDQFSINLDFLQKRKLRKISTIWKRWIIPLININKITDH